MSSRWDGNRRCLVLIYLIKCFQVYASFTWKHGGICWQPKMFILWSCQNVKRTSPLCSSRRDGQKTYMERLIQSPDKEVMPSERCLVVGSSDPSRDFRLSEVPTGVGTSGKPEEICPGVWGYPYVRSSDKSRKFRLSGVPTRVGTSDTSRDFRLDFRHTWQKILFGSGLLDSDPNCSKLVGNLENKACRGFLPG